MTVSILVSTHHVVLGQLLTGALGSEGDFAPVRYCRWGKDALEAARKRPWTVILLDAGSTDLDPFDLAASIQRVRPRARILFFAHGVPMGWVARSLEVGAAGYLGCCASKDDYVRAIRAVAGDQAFFSPCAARIVADLAAKEQRMPVLSARERAVLRHLCDGRPSKEIATLLRISVKGVEAVRSRLMKRSGTSSAAALVRFALTEGLIRSRPASQPVPSD